MIILSLLHHCRHTTSAVAKGRTKPVYRGNYLFSTSFSSSNSIGSIEHECRKNASRNWSLLIFLIVLALFEPTKRVPSRSCAISIIFFYCQFRCNSNFFDWVLSIEHRNRNKSLSFYLLSQLVKARRGNKSTYREATVSHFDTLVSGCWQEKNSQNFNKHNVGPFAILTKTFPWRR